MLRAIHFFPNFDDDEEIQQFRQAYDPLALKIRPHLTLVFPFESDITSAELVAHIEQQLESIAPFEVVLKGVTGDEEGSLFLTVKKGNDQIIAIHDCLYQGILAGYLWRQAHYMPHLTLGHTNDDSDFLKALSETADWQREYRAILHQVVVEIIEDDGLSRIEAVVALKGKR